jgi:predicted permease
MSALVTLLIPLFGAIGIGAGSRLFRLFDAEDARRMSRFVFMIAMPIAGFEFMRQSDPAGSVFLGLACAYFMALGVASFLAFFVARRVLGLTVREAGAAVFSTTCGNAIFLGIPIALSVEAWASPFLILVLFEGTAVFAIGAALMTWPNAEETEGSGIANALRSTRQAFYRAVRSPIVIGTLYGLVAAALALPIAEPIAALLAFMSRVAGPVGLFVLGLSIADLLAQRGLQDLKAPLVLLPIKLLLFPAMMGSLTWLFTADQGATSAAILFTGLPPAVASIVLSSVYRQWIGGTSAVVAAGTVTGLVTLTAFLFVALPS